MSEQTTHNIDRDSQTFFMVTHAMNGFSKSIVEYLARTGYHTYANEMCFNHEHTEVIIEISHINNDTGELLGTAIYIIYDIENNDIVLEIPNDIPRFAIGVLMTTTLTFFDGLCAHMTIRRDGQIY